MCNVCAALIAMRETLEYETKDGELYYILGVGEEAEGKPARFQIRREGVLWQDKWITTNDLASSMASLGADVCIESRTDKNWEYFRDTLKVLGIENDEPK